jgi:hypothetical protein
MTHTIHARPRHRFADLDVLSAPPAVAVISRHHEVRARGLCQLEGSANVAVIGSR